MHATSTLSRRLEAGARLMADRERAQRGMAPLRDLPSPCAPWVRRQFEATGNYWLGQVADRGAA